MKNIDELEGNWLVNLEFRPHARILQEGLDSPTSRVECCPLLVGLDCRILNFVYLCCYLSSDCQEQVQNGYHTPLVLYNDCSSASSLQPPYVYSIISPMTNSTELLIINIHFELWTMVLHPIFGGFCTLIAASLPWPASHNNHYSGWPFFFLIYRLCLFVNRRPNAA